MRLELSSHVIFEAIHSLSEREEPHKHIFELSIAVTGPVSSGRIMGLVELRELLEQVVSPLKGSYLNENRILDRAAQENPTCESLATYFVETMRSRLPSTVSICWVEVKISEADGSFWGAARWTV